METAPPVDDQRTSLNQTKPNEKHMKPVLDCVRDHFDDHSELFVLQFGLDFDHEDFNLRLCPSHLGSKPFEKQP